MKLSSTPLLVLLALLGFVSPGLTAVPNSPLEKSPQLLVSVDPRVELLSLIFRLAGNPEYNRPRVDSYSHDVETHFEAFRDHPVVALASQLRNTRGVSYDACMG